MKLLLNLNGSLRAELKAESQAVYSQKAGKQADYLIQLKAS